MTLGKLRCTTIEDDASNSITVADLVTLNSDKAPTASPTFTTQVTLPATTALAGQASDITIMDNDAAALEVKEGSTAYVTFDTTDGDEQIEISKKVELANHLEFSAAKDILIPDNQANALDIAEGANAYVTFDTTDSNEQIEVAKKVVLSNHLEFSTAKDVLIPDNQATALEVKEGTNGFVTFDTTDSAERIVVDKAVVASNNITLNATNELRLADSDSSNYIAIKAPDTVASNVTLKLPADDGNADEVLTTNGSGVLSWATPSGGKILQVVQSIKTSIASTDNNSWSDTGITVNITPSSTSSKILVSYSFEASHYAGAYSGGFRLVRVIGGSQTNNLYLGDAASNRTQASNWVWSGNYGYAHYCKTGQLLDSPSTTSQITYKMEFISRYSGYTLYMGKSHSGDGDGSTSGRVPSQITVMEIEG